MFIFTDGKRLLIHCPLWIETNKKPFILYMTKTLALLHKCTHSVHTLKPECSHKSIRERPTPEPKTILCKEYDQVTHIKITYTSYSDSLVIKVI